MAKRRDTAQTAATSGDWHWDTCFTTKTEGVRVTGPSGNRALKSRFVLVRPIASSLGVLGPSILAPGSGKPGNEFSSFGHECMPYPDARELQMLTHFMIDWLEPAL